MSILDTIVAYKHQEVAARKRDMPLDTLQALLPAAPRTRDFRAALLDPARPSPRVIAEVKRRSPSKGVIRPVLDAVSIATTYEQNGAAAISVLTDSRFFGGSLDDLSAVCAAAGVPVLCKEFITDPYQLYEARLAGASAVLLIAGILAIVELRGFRELAAELGMAALVEVHDRAELGAALASGAEIVGINNRDLRTFNVSLQTTRDLRPLIPHGVVTVSESGISSADRDHMSRLNVDALLVGESLLSSPDVALAARAISGLHVPTLEKSLR